MNDNILNILFEFIPFFEGKRYKSYKDGAGKLTIGIGHTLGVTEGMTATDDQIKQWFSQDLHDANLRVTTMVKVPLNDNQYACMVDIGYNLSYASSVNLSKYVNTDVNEFKTKLLLYCNDFRGGKEKGLLIRRIAERLLFEGRDWKIVSEYQKPNFTVQMINDEIVKLFS